jgi:hypothetical protein
MSARHPLTYPGGSVVPTALGGPDKRPTVLAESPDYAEWFFPASLSWAHYLFLALPQSWCNLS